MVTRTFLRAGFGPFARVFPCFDLHPVAVHPATSWRRLYARREVLLEMAGTAAPRTFLLPSNDPEALVALLQTPTSTPPP